VVLAVYALKLLRREPAAVQPQGTLAAQMR
jgi:hypothetical protein